MRLTRQAFDEAACRLARAQPTPPTDSHRLSTGWSWKEHPTHSGYGYLEKTATRRIRGGIVVLENEPESDLIEEDDTAVALTSNSSDFCRVTFHICLSPTFYVPTLYFVAFRSTGGPLTLKKMLESTIFHPSSSAVYPFTTLDASSNTSRTPFVSQGEHPTLGTTAWFLHPCETESILSEIMQPRNQNAADSTVDDVEDRVVKYLRSWLMVVGTVVDLREPSLDFEQSA